MDAQTECGNYMNEAVEKILPLERDLFFALNGSDSVFLDNIMWTVTGRFIWGPLLLFMLFLFFYKTPLRESLLVVFIFVLLFTACDQVASSFFKPVFERFRPTHHPDFMDMVDIVNGYRGGRFGFISSHATNSFGLAVFLSLLFKNRWLTLSVLLWALVNSYSRIYLGVHFISDIVAGMIVGSLLAFLLYKLYQWIRYRFFVIPQYRLRRSVYPEKHAVMLAAFIMVNLVLIVIFNQSLSTLPH